MSSVSRVLVSAVLFVVCCGAGGPRAGSVAAEEPDEVGGQSIERGADVATAPTISTDFGQFEIDGRFSYLTPIPDGVGVLAVDRETQRLVSVDLLAADIVAGPSVSSGTDDILMTPSGTFAYVVDALSPSHLANSEETEVAGSVTQVRVSDLSVVRTITLDVGEEVIALRRPQVQLDPDDETRLLVIIEDGIFVFDDGVLLSDHVERGADRIDIFPGGYGYFRETYAPIAYSFRVTPTGTTELTTLGEARDGPFGRVGDSLLWDGTYYSVPDLSPVAPPDLAWSPVDVDPSLPLQYGRSGASTVILDSDGVELTRASDCRLADGVLVGDGYEARLDPPGSGAIVVSDIIDRCGAYGDFTPLAPARVVDTRNGMGLIGSTPVPLTGGTVTRMEIHGHGGVPATGVESVVLNVTAIHQRDSERNYITVWPAGFDRPEVANVNLEAGDTTGNMVTVSTSAGGYVDVYSDSGTVDLTIDVMGYFRSALVAPASRYRAVSPERRLDTRSTTPVGPGQSRTLSFAADRMGGAELDAVVLNVTAVRPSSRSHLRIFPAGTGLPDASAMNFPAGDNSNRLVTVSLGANDSIELWNASGTTDITVDVVGVYESGTHVDQSGRFLGLVPERLVDTRADSPFAGDGRLTADSVIILPGFPTDIALVTNLTAIRPGGGGFMSARAFTPYADFGSTSSLNFAAGRTIGNQAIITPQKRGENAGEIGVYASAPAHLTLDLFGYYT